MDTSITPASNFIFANISGETEEIKISDNNYNGYKAILHFRVPFSFITQNTINQICLYAKGEDDDKKYSAYYLFTERNDEGTEVLAPITVNNQQTSYNLIIE